MVSAACLDGSPIRSYTASRLTTGSATEAGSMSDSSDDDPTLSPRRPCLRPRSHIARVERYERLRKSSVDHALRADFLEEQLLLHKQGLGFDLEAEVVQQRIALDQRQQEVRQLKLDMVRAAEIIDSLTADRDAAKNENSLLATELEAAKATISNLTTKLCEAEHDRLRAREEVEEALHLNRERADQQTEVERLETERRGLHDQVRYLENRLRASEDAVERGRVTLARERNNSRDEYYYLIKNNQLLYAEVQDWRASAELAREQNEHAIGEIRQLLAAIDDYKSSAAGRKEHCKCGLASCRQKLEQSVSKDEPTLKLGQQTLSPINSPYLKHNESENRADIATVATNAENATDKVHKIQQREKQHGPNIQPAHVGSDTMHDQASCSGVQLDLRLPLHPRRPMADESSLHHVMVW